MLWSAAAAGASMAAFACTPVADGTVDSNVLVAAGLSPAATWQLAAGFTIIRSHAAKPHCLVCHTVGTQLVRVALATNTSASLLVSAGG
jgi:hypothetical protein